MSKKYNEAMEKIVASDELKKKILNSTSQKILLQKRKTVRTYNFYLKHIAVYAACIMLFAAGIFAANKYVSVYLNSDNGAGDDRLTQNEQPQYNNTVIKDADSYKNNKSEPNGKSNDKTNSANKSPIENNIYGENNNGNTQITDLPDKSNNAVISEPKKNTESGAAAEPEPQNPELASPPPQQPTDDDNSYETGVMGSPFIENFAADISGIGELKNKVGYEFKYPKSLPDGYVIYDVSLFYDTLIHISYEKGDSIITYRTENSSDNISGEYDVYEDEINQTINGCDVKLKCNNDKCFLAEWHNNGKSYSLYCSDGLDMESIINIIKSI